MIVLAVALASVVTFVASFGLYALPPIGALIARTSTARPGVPMWAMALSVLLRSIVVSALVAGLLLAAGWHGAGAGALLGLALTVLPALLLSGAIIHENVPVPTAAVHLTDWAVKLIVAGAIVGAFL